MNLGPRSMKPEDGVMAVRKKKWFFRNCALAACPMLACLGAPNANAADLAAELVDLFARACFGQPSPAAAAESAALANSWPLDPEASSQNERMHGMPLSKKTWRIGKIGNAAARMVAVTIDAWKSPNSRSEYCTVIAEPFAAGHIESALRARLKLAEPTQRSQHDSRAGNATEPDFVVTTGWPRQGTAVADIVIETNRNEVRLFVHRDYPPKWNFPDERRRHQ